eukprot:scaffold73649_cov62-Phaeocystis_antarctica.AAC.4
MPNSLSRDSPTQNSSSPSLAATELLVNATSWSPEIPKSTSLDSPAQKLSSPSLVATESPMNLTSLSPEIPNSPSRDSPAQNSSSPNLDATELLMNVISPSPETPKSPSRDSPAQNVSSPSRVATELPMNATSPSPEIPNSPSRDSPTQNSSSPILDATESLMNVISPSPEIPNSPSRDRPDQNSSSPSLVATEPVMNVTNPSPVMLNSPSRDSPAQKSSSSSLTATELLMNATSLSPEMPNSLSRDSPAQNALSSSLAATEFPMNVTSPSFEMPYSSRSVGILDSSEPSARQDWGQKLIILLAFLSPIMSASCRAFPVMAGVAGVLLAGAAVALLAGAAFTHIRIPPTADSARHHGREHRTGCSYPAAAGYPRARERARNFPAVGGATSYKRARTTILMLTYPGAAAKGQLARDEAQRARDCPSRKGGLDLVVFEPYPKCAGVREHDMRRPQDVGVVRLQREPHPRRALRAAPDDGGHRLGEWADDSVGGRVHRLHIDGERDAVEVLDGEVCVQHLGATHLATRQPEVAAAEVKLRLHRPRDVERDASDDKHLARRLVDRVHGIGRARHAIDESHDAVAVVTDEVAAEHVDSLGADQDRLRLDHDLGLGRRVRVIDAPWQSWHLS